MAFFVKVVEMWLWSTDACFLLYDDVILYLVLYLWSYDSAFFMLNAVSHESKVTLEGT